MIQIRGGDQFRAISQRLHSTERTLPTQFRGGLGKVAAGLVGDARRNALHVLPKRGGYNEVVARSHFEVVFARTARGQRVTITATGPDYRVDRQGRLRHPVYADGRRSEWAWAKQTQKVRPGWFTKPMKAGRPRIRAELVAVMSRSTRRV